MASSTSNNHAINTKNMFNVRQESCDNVVEQTLKLATYTASKLVEPVVPFNFLEHAGCKRNLSFEEAREKILARGEGSLEEHSEALLVDTGKFTGRCPKDRYIVNAGEAASDVGWGDINRGISEDVFNQVMRGSAERLWGLEEVFVFDGFVGASKGSRKAVRVVTELAWHHHFCTNMFIRPTPEELASFQPDITILNSRYIFEGWKEAGLRSETCVALDLNRGLSVITGTEYSGEMKKGAFSMMNYYLPLQNIMSMHCSATVGKRGDTAIFFGLSGTGKTTLSADTTRFLIGDDEHGWDEEGIFNLEGGCYAKMIDLDPSKEPLIHAAIKKNAILENVVLDRRGYPDYKDISKTENTRGSYPMWHIPNYKPSGTAPPPRNIIFLTCDAFGVLPPVSRLSTQQALYHLVCGYTSKVAGTEMGITEPTPTFSICFGGAFMPLPARAYAELFRSKIEQHGCKVFLVNTGWSGGSYGTGRRMDINTTRAIVAAILDGSIEEAAFSSPDPFFQLCVPLALPGIDPKVLNPRNTWASQEAYEATSRKLMGMYQANWQQFASDPFMAELSRFGPGGDGSP
eukprot:738341-Hanusia_phi.AAC.5